MGPQRTRSIWSLESHGKLPKKGQNFWSEVCVVHTGHFSDSLVYAPDTDKLIASSIIFAHQGPSLWANLTTRLEIYVSDLCFPWNVKWKQRFALICRSNFFYICFLFLFHVIVFLLFQIFLWKAPPKAKCRILLRLFETGNLGAGSLIGRGKDHFGQNLSSILYKRLFLSVFA